jgi:hypothetical protein
VALRRPRPETIAELEAELADSDEARRAELMGQKTSLICRINVSEVDFRT